MTSPIRLERHSLGPRLHLLGRRVHEYHVGFAVLAVAPVVSLVDSPHPSPGNVIAALVGLWLVIKDWPDLFRATRDKASWRLGLHRLPEGDARAVAAAARDRVRSWFRAAQMPVAASAAVYRRRTSDGPR